MKEKIIINNSIERVTVNWDGERYALVQWRMFCGSVVSGSATVIILNPAEMLSLIEFAGNPKRRFKSLDKPDQRLNDKGGNFAY